MQEYLVGVKHGLQTHDRQLVVHQNQVQQLRLLNRRRILLVSRQQLQDALQLKDYLHDVQVEQLIVVQQRVQQMHDYRTQL